LTGYAKIVINDQATCFRSTNVGGLVPINAWLAIMSSREWGCRHNPSLLQNVDVVDLMGQLQMSKFIAFLHTMNGIVASGTGPVHIDAAMGCTRRKFFVNDQHPFDVVAPVGPRAEILERLERPSTQARVCSMQPLGSLCACTAVVDPEQVRERLLKWLPVPPAHLPKLPPDIEPTLCL